MKICIVSDCNREAVRYQKTLCTMHGFRMDRHGSTDLYVKPLVSENICSFEGCDNFVFCLELCNSHYYQQQRGKELTQIGSTHYQKIDSDICGNEGCNQLRNVKPSGSRDKRCTQCRCLWQSHRLTLAEAQSIWDKQDHKCGNCKIAGPELYIPGHLWHIDHDHGCCNKMTTRKSCDKCRRGIVCKTCNTYALTEHMTYGVWVATGKYLGYLNEEDTMSLIDVRPNWETYD